MAQNMIRVGKDDLPILFDTLGYSEIIDAYDGDIQKAGDAIDGKGKNIVKDAITLAVVLANNWQDAHGEEAVYTVKDFSRRIPAGKVADVFRAVRKEILEGMKRENTEDEPETVDLTLAKMEAGKNA